MNDTSKAIIVASLILAIALVASAWIFSQPHQKNHRYSLLKTNNTVYDALKIDHETGQVWYIRQGSETKTRTNDH